MNSACWCMYVIPRAQQAEAYGIEDQGFLGYRVNSRLAWDIPQEKYKLKNIKNIFMSVRLLLADGQED